MTYYMQYDIRIGQYRVGSVKSVSVHKSLERLSDTARIVIPGSLVNETLKVERNIKVGDEVSILLGYIEVFHEQLAGDGTDSLESGQEGGLAEEFHGYVKRVNTDNTDIVIECEDELYMWEVSLKDEQVTNCTLKTLLQKVAQQVNAAKNTSYDVSCDYDFTYKKFTISKATAWDVLKLVQDECKANIYFDGKTLHIHPQFSEGSWSGKTHIYDMAVNVISSDLKYMSAKDRKVEVTINYYDNNGKKHKASYGTTGGKKVERTITSASDEKSIQKAAENEWNLWNYDGYEGGLTGWLIPFVVPMDRVDIRDSAYEDKKSIYYVVATDVEFGSSGGRRKVTIGKKVG